MKTIKDVFAAFKSGLSNTYDLNEIESITILSISDVTDLSKAKIKAFPETELADEQSRGLKEILSQLQTGKPIQYILGATDFYGLPFKLNSYVLIPRPETEELVDWVLRSVGSLKLAVGNILDIGTGSGCIAISLKKNIPTFNVSAIDISNEALKTAKENAEANEVKVSFIKDDIMDVKSEIEHPKFDIIISNPPYVTLQDKTQMHINVTDFEPHIALFVPENDPLVFYKAIADFAKNNLEPNGLLFFEINENYSEQVANLLKGKDFINIELRKDMNGKDRMIKANR